MRIAALLFCIYLLGGCTSVKTGTFAKHLQAAWDPRSLQSIHRDLMSKFTFVLQPVEMDTYQHHSGHRPFKGDCDDYLAAAKSRLIESGYLPIAVTGYGDDGVLHAFTCAQGPEVVCLDPNFSRVRALTALRRVYSEVTVYHYPELQPFKTAGAESALD